MRSLPWFLFLAGAVTAGAAATQTPTPLTPGTPATGTLSADDPTLPDDSHYDLWILQADPGTRFRILLTSSEFDTFLSVGSLGTDGFEPTGSNDDYDPPSTDSRLDATVPTGGVLYVRVNSFSAGETGTYTLAVSAAPHAAVGGIRSIDPATVAGAEFVDDEPFTRGGGMPAHFWQFQAVAGERYAITMFSADVDCYLSIGSGDPDGFSADESNDDVDGGTDSRIIFTAPTSGPVLIRASTFAVQTGGYRLAVQRLPAEAR